MLLNIYVQISRLNTKTTQEIKYIFFGVNKILYCDDFCLRLARVLMKLICCFRKNMYNGALL